MKTALSLWLLWYFRFWAKLQLRKKSPCIIGVTGSAGKTTTLHAIEAALSPHYSLKVSHKANSESGLPLDILGLHTTTYGLLDWLVLALQAPVQLLLYWPKHEIYLAEMGIDGPLPPKNMEYLLSFLRPKVGVLLNVSPTHTEPFETFLKLKQRSPSEKRSLLKEAVAKEKGKLITQLPPSGLAVLGYDDPVVRSLAKTTKAKTVFFGTSAQATIQIKSITCTPKGTKISLQEKSSHHTLLLDGIALPQSVGTSFAAAVGVAKFFTIPTEQALQNISRNFTLPPGRSSLIPGLHNSTILDSSYNANAKTMLDSLELLKTIAPKRKIAILADMREIGSLAEQEHKVVAQKAAEVCDQVVLVGPLMKQYALPLLEAKQKVVSWHASAKEAGEFLAPTLQPKDMVLVKGSQNTLLTEIAVEILMKNKKDATKLLCRRGSFWDSQRAKLIKPHSP